MPSTLKSKVKWVHSCLVLSYFKLFLYSPGPQNWEWRYLLHEDNQGNSPQTCSQANSMTAVLHWDTFPQLSWQFSLIGASHCCWPVVSTEGFSAASPTSASVMYNSHLKFLFKMFAAKVQCSFLRLSALSMALFPHWHILSLATHWQIPLRQNLDSSCSSLQRILFHFAIRLESQLSPASSGTVIQIPQFLPWGYSRLCVCVCVHHLSSLIFVDNVFSTVTNLTVHENIQFNGRGILNI